MRQTFGDHAKMRGFKMSTGNSQTNRIPARQLARELTEAEVKAVSGAGGGNTKPNPYGDPIDTNYN